MNVEISKTNYRILMGLIDKAVTIIQSGNPPNRDYNVARRLRQTKAVIVRQVEKQNIKKTK